MMFESKGNPRVTKKCEQCGESFRTRNQDRKYCSANCRHAADYIRNRHDKVDTGIGISEENILEDAHV